MPGRRPDARGARGVGAAWCQRWAQAQVGPHWHEAPQAQAKLAAGPWQPQVQAAPAQGLQGQTVGVGVGVVAFMMEFLGGIGGGMSSMA